MSLKDEIRKQQNTRLRHIGLRGERKRQVRHTRTKQRDLDRPKDLERVEQHDDAHDQKKRLTAVTAGSWSVFTSTVPSFEGLKACSGFRRSNPAPGQFDGCQSGGPNQNRVRHMDCV